MDSKGASSDSGRVGGVNVNYVCVRRGLKAKPGVAFLKCVSIRAAVRWICARVSNFVDEGQGLGLGSISNNVAHVRYGRLIWSSRGIGIDYGRSQLAVALDRHCKRKAGCEGATATSGDRPCDGDTPNADICWQRSRQGQAHRWGVRGGFVLCNSTGLGRSDSIF